MVPSERPVRLRGPGGGPVAERLPLPLRAPATGIWYCGNAVGDPYGMLVKYVVPVSATCAAAIARRGLRERRWGCREVAGLVAFAATSACLLAEGRLLVRSGFELGRIWWLPGL